MNAVNLQTMQMGGIPSRAERNSAVGSSGQVNPFMEIFASMVSAMNEDEEMTTENPQDLLLMLMSGYGLTDLSSVNLSGFYADGQSETTNVNLSQSQILQLIMSKISGSDVEGKTNTANSFMQALQSKGIDLQSLEALNVQSMNFNNNSSSQDMASGEEFLFGQREFLNSIELVKTNLSDGENPEFKSDLMATMANLRVLTPTQSTSVGFENSQFSVNTQTLATQLESGIKENLNAQNTEFTMKLYPESLGEITVKLVNENGVKALEIVTASAKTAMLINDDLPALRDAMSGMQIEVRSAVEASGSSNASNMQNFNMSSQEFAQRQWSFEREQSNQNFNSQNAETAENADESSAVLPEGERRIYV